MQELHKGTQHTCTQHAYALPSAFSLNLTANTMQASRDASRAQDEAAQLKQQLSERAPLQALPNDPFNKSNWLSKKFERTRPRNSGGDGTRALRSASVQI